MGNANSIGDYLLFPAPAPSYDASLPCLIWIDEEFSVASPPPSTLKYKNSCMNGDKGNDDASICSIRDPKREKFLFPALFFHAPAKTKFTILYWHGNSCDLGQIFEELQVLSTFLNCNICAIEFPGYGLRCNTITTVELIDKWGKAAFNFIVWLGIPPQCIICFGRSIGTGPACKLAATLKEIGINVGGVVLHAPYISVHKIVDEYVPMASWFVRNYWNNAQSLSKLSPDCPLLIIHGNDDEIIPTIHGKTLYENYVSDCKEGFFPDDSSHNAYYVIDDIGKPMQLFFEKKSRSKLCLEKSIKIPDLFYCPPAFIAVKSTTKKEAKAAEENINKIPIEDGLSGAVVSPFMLGEMLESRMINDSNMDDIVNEGAPITVEEIAKKA